jgi:hypothetical protein
MKKYNFILQHIAAVILLTVIIVAPLYAYESRTCLQGEVLRDIINYSDDEASLISRLRFSENIDDIFILNYSLLRDINRKINQYTWNIGLNNLGDHINFIAGNYNMRFGSGLIMGKKKFITSDSFSRISYRFP